METWVGGRTIVAVHTPIDAVATLRFYSFILFGIYSFLSVHARFLDWGCASLLYSFENNEQIAFLAGSRLELSGISGGVRFLLSISPLCGEEVFFFLSFYEVPTHLFTAHLLFPSNILSVALNRIISGNLKEALQQIMNKLSPSFSSLN